MIINASANPSSSVPPHYHDAPLQFHLDLPHPPPLLLQMVALCSPVLAAPWLDELEEELEELAGFRPRLAGGGSPGYQLHCLMLCRERDSCVFSCWYTRAVVVRLCWLFCSGTANSPHRSMHPS
jgi:hypothetical protein